MEGIEKSLEELQKNHFLQVRVHPPRGFGKHHQADLAFYNPPVARYIIKDHDFVEDLAGAYKVCKGVSVQIDEEGIPLAIVFHHIQHFELSYSEDVLDGT